MPALKRGALTRADFLDAWRGASDAGYREPMEAAGDGKGFEAWGQLFAQLERTSRAVDATTQSMFISPWSGQTSAPAGGARSSTVSIALSRAGLLPRSLILERGQVAVEEVQVVPTALGGAARPSGRRYVLAETAFFPPGFRGPVSVVAVAERPGPGFDDPLPGSIRSIPQPGDGFANDLASVVGPAYGSADPAQNRSRFAVVAAPEADMFVPDHVGQYVLFAAGANAGKAARVLDFGAPDPDHLLGSSLGLEPVASLYSGTFSGSFVEGETVAFSSGGGALGYGRVLGSRVVSGVRWVAVRRYNGTLGTRLDGISSGAIMTGAAISEPGAALVAEAPSGGVGGASWRVLSWASDWGLSATNAASPAGGRAAMLDELGLERGIPRSIGEGDDAYRLRVRDPGDVVSPNAIRRALNRQYAGHYWALAEVGYPSLPGAYFDGANEPPSATPHGAGNDAYDTDVLSLTGTGTPSFAAGEKVVLEGTDFALYAEGYHGRGASGSMLFVLRGDAWRLPTSFASVRVRSPRTGATWTCTAATRPASADARRIRTWFDYEQFRAFFRVDVAPLRAGEFGFAYDAGDRSAYDAGPPYAGAYDGFPVGAADLYRQVHSALAATKAGGVGFSLFLDRTAVDPNPDGVGGGGGSGSYVWVVDKSVGWVHSTASNKVSKIDVSDPASPFLAAQIDLSAYGGAARVVKKHGNYVFVALFPLSAAGSGGSGLLGGPPGNNNEAAPFVIIDAITDQVVGLGSVSVGGSDFNLRPRDFAFDDSGHVFVVGMSTLVGGCAVYKYLISDVVAAFPSVFTGFAARFPDYQTTTIAAGSDGQGVYGAAVINVASTAGFPGEGFLLIDPGSGYRGNYLVYYTGKTPTSFTGCTGGQSGAPPVLMHTGNPVAMRMIDHIETVDYGGGYLWASTGLYFNLGWNSTVKLAGPGRLIRIDPVTGALTTYTGAYSNGALWGCCYAFGSVWASGGSYSSSQKNKIFRFNPATFPSAPTEIVVDPSTSVANTCELIADASTIWVTSGGSDDGGRSRLWRVSTGLGTEAVIASPATVGVVGSVGSTQGLAIVKNAVWTCLRFSEDPDGVGLLSFSTGLGTEAYIQRFNGGGIFFQPLSVAG